MNNALLTAFCRLSLETNLSDASLQALAMALIVGFDSTETAESLVAAYDSLSVAAFRRLVR